MVVIVTDFRLGLVEGLSDYVLGHVDSRGVCVLSLYRVFSVSADPGTRLPKYQLLESPLPDYNTQMREKHTNQQFFPQFPSSEL